MKVNKDMACSLEIALLEPEIPGNTGNIARTCVALGAKLHLVGKLGFKIDDKRIKRSGLDYWFDLDLTLWDHLDDLFHDFLERYPDGGIYYTSSKAKICYTEVNYPDHTLFLFGRETHGLPESLLLAHPERSLRMPMLPEARCLNLSNAAAIAAYEFMRQKNFPGLLKVGEVTGRGD
ncbi:tRNA (cytidine(34)-2'-O)-methyltransferase [Amygdalobacter nucleatus]|uniref:Putative tRNA (cytidine(34)-2'-O)-methyltransferase n=2 Tax=Amygdalobacter nucleatus TaxID=3029274 RepID=A0A133YH48_9FIRM|nr:tRNA (cytidine(34)-2'-O)-methyltransferase [Amygdalobacter nucleatus]KXB42510.1 RNA methyltransferase, TrmH family, group 2 [Amygdalobacter nucleatus]MDF0486084.1 tRNA (cytidine(34)-2'-O)-methyltransferase [Amygdalobacter nucleatus]WEG37360.1 tRNA (cytidine(34)-2'-O)-methyltransferase [Amygdalobacter nucleatus]